MEPIAQQLFPPVVIAFSTAATALLAAGVLALLLIARALRHIERKVCAEPVAPPAPVQATPSIMPMVVPVLAPQATPMKIPEPAPVVPHAVPHAVPYAVPNPHPEPGYAVPPLAPSKTEP